MGEATQVCLKHRAGNLNWWGFPSLSVCDSPLSEVDHGQELFDPICVIGLWVLWRRAVRVGGGAPLRGERQLCGEAVGALKRSGSSRRPVRAGRLGRGRLAPLVPSCRARVEARADITMPELAAGLAAERGVKAPRLRPFALLAQGRLTYKKNADGIGMRARATSVTGAGEPGSGGVSQGCDASRIGWSSSTRHRSTPR